MIEDLNIYHSDQIENYQEKICEEFEMECRYKRTVRNNQTVYSE